MTSTRWSEPGPGPVAVADPNGLYDPALGTDQNVGNIMLSGGAGSYSYAVEAGDHPNLPVTYVSWQNALRFANWMHSGAPRRRTGREHDRGWRVCLCRGNERGHSEERGRLFPPEQPQNITNNNGGDSNQPLIPGVSLRSTPGYRLRSLPGSFPKGIGLRGAWGL